MGALAPADEARLTELLEEMSDPAVRYVPATLNPKHLTELLEEPSDPAVRCTAAAIFSAPLQG